MKKNKSFYNKYLSGKPIILLHFTASLTAFTIIVYISCGMRLNFYAQLFSMILFLMGGLITGTILLLIDKKGKLIKNEIIYYILLQPSYLLAVIVFVLLLKVFNMGVITSISLAIYFLIGLACGIFDYRKIDLKKYLILGCIPVIITILYYIYLSNSIILNNYIMYSSLAYLSTLLLILNRIKLDRVIYSCKEINLKNKHKIRVSNDIKIMIMFIGFTLTLTILKYSTMLKTAYNNLLNKLLSKIPYFGQSEANFDDFENPVFDLPKSATSLERDIFVFIIAIFILAITICILILLFIVLKYLYISIKNRTRRVNLQKNIIMGNDDYEEESIITKEKMIKISKKSKTKFLYDLSKIQNVVDDKERMRYLYGYNLEQMIDKGIKIKRQQTPVEILDEVKKDDFGSKYATLYFSNITNEYIRTRYGDKYPECTLLKLNKFSKFKRDFHRYLKKASVV